MTFVILSKLLIIFSLIYASKSYSSFREPRIIGGNRTEIQKVPYQLSLLINGTHCCGATLIKETLALSAAHCIPKIGPFYAVRAGSSYLNKGGVVIKVKKAVVHEKYKKNIWSYDISVLILEKPFIFGPSIKPATLPLPHELYLPKKALISGWGLSNSHAMVHKLKSAYVDIYNEEVCKKAYPESWSRDTLICAGNIKDTADACQGDSGGPLVSNGTIIGIIAWGEGCGSRKYPGVYTKVSAFINFIQKAIAS